MKPLRVLQVFTILNRGGAETNLMNYYRQIDREVVQFDFLVHRQEEGAYEEEIKKLGGQIFRLPALNPLRIKHYKEAVKKFFDDHSDYQIIHGQCSELGVFIYEESKRRNIPVIIAHAHNSPKLSDYDLKFLFREMWKNKMRKSINAYFTCGQDAAKWLFGKRLSGQSYQMNNAVNTEKFAFDLELQKKEKAELSAGNDLFFFHVGRFNKQKNHRFLIEIFSEIVKLQPKSHLFLVGEGSLKTTVEKQVNQVNLREKVTFLGLRDDVAALFQAMDVFLFPSLFEGLPVALVEAQASGILCAIANTISAEAILVPENVKVYALTDSAKFWAEEILQEASAFKRTNVSQIIKDAGYDINDNVTELEEQYLELYKRFS